MNKCGCCKINVYPQHINCPICGKELEGLIQSETSYPKYIIKKRKGFTIKKFFLFVSIVGCIISLFVNTFTFDKELTIWSAIVAAALISLWVIIYVISNKRINVGKKILYSYGVLATLLMVIDLSTGFNKWSTTYVIPFFTVAVAFVFTIMAISNRKNYIEYLGVLIAMFFISVCSIILFLLSLTTETWTSFIAVLYCLLTIIGLIIFSGRKFKQEIKKRFHF